jgi:energy-coupling factor transporter ATP-binding protein EcfA2
VGIQQLQQAWAEYRPRVADEYEEWDANREATAPRYIELFDSFRDGGIDLLEFRRRVDLLSREKPFFGFKGTNQMFLNQLVKNGEPESVEAALKAALPVPADEDEAKLKLENFVLAVEAAREHADQIGASRPGVGRVDAFVSMFWEFADREAWPALYPNSRHVLVAEGLLEDDLPQPELYLAYRAVMEELKSSLQTSTWNVEHLLWSLRGGDRKKSKRQKGRKDPEPGETPEDLYDFYAGRGLYLPDEIVTSFVLSLKTKPFVILSGISGTGKTKIAQELAHFLEDSDGEVPATAAPQAGPKDVFVKLTAAQIKRSFAPITEEARKIVEGSLSFPKRGESIIYKARIPGGSVEEVRITNYGFADESRDLYRMIFRGDAKAWLQEKATAGDVLHLQLQADGEAELELSLEQGVEVPSDTSDRRYALIPVKSDWTDPRGLIGFFNPITREYVTTELVDLLVRADADPEHPYLVILDEMNLARVEYYFSDFLSVLESGETVRLMTEEQAKLNAGKSEEAEEGGSSELPEALEIPPNVSFIGTVNVDETTHPLSPKVLDRANVIEFDAVDLDLALDSPAAGAGGASGGLRLAPDSDVGGWLRDFEAGADEARARALSEDDFTAAVRSVHGILGRWNLQFGYRVINEMSVFVGHALEKANPGNANVVRESFDLQLNQKVIPKLSGGRELEEPLAALLSFALHGTAEAGASDVDEVLQEVPGASAGTDGGAVDPRYPRAAAKLARMLRRLDATGFVGALE